MTPEGPTAYRLTVSRGARAGLVKLYPVTTSRNRARSAALRFADRIDAEYGAICTHVSPVF